MSATTVRLYTTARTVRPLPPRKKRTLVVDDSTTILHAICTLLEHHKVVEVVGRAENGPETIDRIAELQPELVLLDADMPGMSGLRTALLISQMHPQIEVILMSMDTSAQFRAACAGCGATAMIYKPKFLRELRTFLSAPLQKARAVFGVDI
jgi:DNA-binding NarL/FixJ family response regulator